jgi:hypothetical protein
MSGLAMDQCRFEYTPTGRDSLAIARSHRTEFAGQLLIQVNSAQFARTAVSRRK